MIGAFQTSTSDPNPNPAPEHDPDPNPDDSNVPDPDALAYSFYVDDTAYPNFVVSAKTDSVTNIAVYAATALVIITSSEGTIVFVRIRRAEGSTQS